jgi:Tfp pilus assembly protein FimV
LTPSSSLSGGTSSPIAATAARSSPRETTASMRSHSSSSPTSPPAALPASKSTSTAVASFADARAKRGCRRAFSLTDSRSALPSSSVTISRSKSSRQSSVALASNATTVASSVAKRRERGWRRSVRAFAVIP